MPLDQTPANAPPPPPPRVAGPPVVRNTLQIADDPAAFFAAIHEKYGPISEISVLGTDYVVMGGMEAFDFFIRERERYLSRKAFYARAAEELGSGLLILSEPAGLHQHLRGQMRLGFSRQVAAEFLPDLIDAVDDGIGRAGTNRVNAMDWVGRVAFDQYSRIMCGQSQDAVYDDAYLYAQRIMEVGAKILPSAGFHTPRYKQAKERVLNLMATLVDGYDPASSDGRLTILDTLMAAETDTGEPLDRETKMAAALYGFIGTIVYMNRAISFLLYDLLTDPALLAKVRAEADAVFTSDTPDSLSLRGMTVLRAALKESMRVHPIALGLPFNVDETFVFAGHRVEKGKTCIITGVPGHFAKAFYTDPFGFDLMRCLPPRNEHKRRGAHVPFGFGVRVCPAVGLVDTIVLTTVARLLHRCDVSIDPQGYELKTRLNPLPGPSKAFGLRMRPRETRADQGTPLDPGSLAANALEELFGGGRLNDPNVQAALQRTQARSYPAGRLLIREGDVAETFFILVDGQVDVTAGTQEEKHLARLEPGAFFGELGLLGAGRRTANCRTVGPVMVLEMDRDAFLTIVRDADLVPGEIAASLRHRYLKDRIATAIPRIDGGLLGSLIDGAETRDLAAGTEIIRQGEEAREFFILLTGTAIVTRQQAGEADAAEEVLGTLGPGDFFGEIGILESRPRTATVRVAQDGSASILAVPRDRLLDLVRKSPEARADIGAVLVDRMVRALPQA